MAKKDIRGRKLKEITEMSRLWDAEDLLRNFDEEMARMESGMGHLVYDLEENRVTAWIGPLPVTPRFEVKENEKEVKITVNLPNIPKENIRVNVDNNSVKLFACSDDAICRPHYVAIDSKGVLDPESAKAKMTGDVFEVKVLKKKKKRVQVK